MNKSIEELRAEGRSEEEIKEYVKKYAFPGSSFVEKKENEEQNIKNLKEEFCRLVFSKQRDISTATELIVKYILEKRKIYTTKEDTKQESWIYEDGIYVPKGKSEVKEIIRNILEEHYSNFFFNIIMSKIEADTFIEPSKFFNNNYIYEIPVENGILNVLEKRLYDFTPDKIFFSKLPVKFDKTKKCPAINKFLSEVLSHEEDKKVFFELAGYGLLKDYPIEKAIMFVGNGRNGKGKSLELLKRLVGANNCTNIPLTSMNHESFVISELFGKLFNLAGDISNQDFKDTSLFKALTGRDLISAKRKFLSNIIFQNYAKFIFACNELPMIYDASLGFWDRWVLLEFPYIFLTHEEYEKMKDKTNVKIRDENIIEKISTPDEMSGLLNEALEGLNRLLKNHNFSITKGTQQIKELWIKKANSFIAFCLENIEEYGEGRIIKKELRKRYSHYCKTYNLQPKSDIVIKRVLQETYGANEDRILVGEYPDKKLEYVWEGIKWKSEI